MSELSSMIRLSPGDVVNIELPFSEVCCHMHVAGKRMNVRLNAFMGAQLLNDDGSNFSFAITPGEAGIYHDSEGWYTYA